MAPVLRLFNVILEYPGGADGPIRVLDNITLDVQGGEVISICGLSGCGKSSLARVAAGLIPATEGEVSFRGKRLDGRTPPIGLTMVFQDYNATLFPWATVRENVELGLRRSRRGRDDAARLVNQTLGELRLTDLQGTRVANLSGGQRQRVAVARALVGEPHLLILDEAFSSLDFVLRKQLVRELHELALARHLAVLFVTHDIEDAVQLGNRVVVVTRYINATNMRQVVTVGARRDGSVAPERLAEIRGQIEAMMRNDLLRVDVCPDVSGA